MNCASGVPPVVALISQSACLGFAQIVALANLMPADDSVDELDSYMYQTVILVILVSVLIFLSSQIRMLFLHLIFYETNLAGFCCS